MLMLKIKFWIHCDILTGLIYTIFSGKFPIFMNTFCNTDCLLKSLFFISQCGSFSISDQIFMYSARPSLKV